MKKILLMAVLLMNTLLMAQTWETQLQREHAQLSKAYVENARMCKIVMDKVKIYKKNMRNDELAMATLKHYEEQVKQYCDPIVKSTIK